MHAIINGKVEFDSEEYLLKSVESAENYIKLQPITCLVFTELLARNGTIISREELLEHIWVGRGYSPSNASLNNNIAAIRKGYSTLTGEELFLITLPKQGYEFKCDLEIKQKPPHDLIINNEYKIKNKLIKNYFNVLGGLFIFLVILLVYFFVFASQQPEFKQKKNSKIQVFGSCTFYAYNYAGKISATEKELFESFANERCFEKDSGQYDVFVDLNTRNLKYKSFTSCKKDFEGDYARCINYRVTYTLN
ncbi:winged helix-turn-helix domain-containing protein [Enterobacter roggenkampii]|uniref:winged helix-turn-helix domain-containing protein n=1 Tax=Enterobacter roggenkampii TaxID=1812935 RepID=UPI002A7F5F77|nr:winged helix-turn-helix domain-containing protein [Enterobacter roggenkampii]